MKPLIVAGYMVRYPLGGQVAAHFQYVLGLARMGYDVHFVEDAGWPDACFNPETGVSSDDPGAGISVVEALFRAHGLDGRWTYVAADGTVHGAPREHVARLAPDAPLISLSDVTWLDELERCPVRAYIDEDPAFPQFALAGGDAELRATLDRYSVHFTYGESIGRPECRIPAAGYQWQPARQPIVLDLWAEAPPPGDTWTTLMNWTSYSNVCFEGVEYGQKDVELRRIIDLPGRTAERLAVAVNGPGEVQDELRSNGWEVRDAHAASRSYAAYRAFIHGSRGEFAIAKNAYVATRSGWFSDRSAAYLASGRPVVLQDTGFPYHLPVGEGLLPFTDAGSAAEALERCTADLPRHAAAARRIAEEHLAHEVVLGRLLRGAGIA